MILVSKHLLWPICSLSNHRPAWTFIGVRYHVGPMLFSIQKCLSLFFDCFVSLFHSCDLRIISSSIIGTSNDNCLITLNEIANLRCQYTMKSSVIHVFKIHVSYYYSQTACYNLFIQVHVPHTLTRRQPKLSTRWRLFRLRFTSQDPDWGTMGPSDHCLILLVHYHLP